MLIKSFRQELINFSNVLLRQLPIVKDTSKSKCAAILANYGNFMATTYVLCLTAAWSACKSVKAQNVCTSTLLSQIQADYPRSLQTFVCQAISEATRLDNRIDYNIGFTREMVRGKVSSSSLHALTILSMFQHVSPITLTWLHDAGSKVGFTNFEFIKTQDALYRELIRFGTFESVLEHEAEELRVDQLPDEAINWSQEFLLALFSC